VLHDELLQMNTMGPIWKRFRNCYAELKIDVFWTDVDPNKNLIDYFNRLKVWPEGPVESADAPAAAAENKYRIGVFSYPAAR
jgi:hypothetical protein